MSSPTRPLRIGLVERSDRQCERRTRGAATVFL